MTTSNNQTRPSDPLRFLRCLLLFLTPVTALVMVEMLNMKNPLTNLNLTEAMMNLIWYSMGFFLLWQLFGRKRRSIFLYLLLCWLMGLVNHFVLLYRGRILFPQDITTWQTALNILGEYDFSPNKVIIGSAALMIVWVLLTIIVLPSREKRPQKGLSYQMLAADAVCILYTVLFFFSPILPSLGIKAQQWKTQSNGFLLNFTLALRYSRVQRPAGYSEDTLRVLTNTVKQSDSMTLRSASYISSSYDPDTQDEDTIPDELLTVTNQQDGIQPLNILCIMDESFADMAIFDTLTTNQDTIPFYHNLTMNTIKGWMYSPVTGAGTANVEYEFLTGNSTAFLPDETTPYQLYVKQNMPSLISWAKQLGFRTTTLHPYRSSGWNRTTVYNDFGVDRQLYNTSFSNPKYVRGYISDETDFERLEYLTDFETGDRQFIFNVTMQNHGGYKQGWYNLPHTVTLTERLEGCSTYTEQYLSLMSETDRQLKNLIDHYRLSNEPTMIILFGDHQGKLSQWFYEKKLYGKSLDDRTLEELEQQYVTPFFIWTNYDIEEAQDVMLSTNYLGVLTALLSNYPMTGYQQFLAGLYNQLPVVQPIGMMDKDGLLTDSAKTLDAGLQQQLSQYELLSYYNLFGWKGQRLKQLDSSFFDGRSDIP